MPALGEPAPVMPRVTIVAAGQAAGWRRAALHISLDDGETWSTAGGTAAPGIVGTLAAPVLAGSATLVDRVARIEVVLARDDMALANADAAGLARGANLAFVGDELLQFGRANHVGGATWHLHELWRGRRGTPVDAIVAGASFTLIEAEQALSLGVDAPPKATIRISASGAGDVTPVEVAIVLSGASVVPPAPVRLTGTLAGGMLRLDWRRRSRTDWRWRDAVDAALGEEREAYRVTIVDADGVREIETEGPASAGGGFEVPVSVPLIGTIAVSVRQIGTHGMSAPTTLEL